MDERFFVGKAVTSLQTMLRMIADAIDDEVHDAERDFCFALVLVRQLAIGVKSLPQGFHGFFRRLLGLHAPLELVMEPKAALTPGSDNRNVLLIQAMLHNLHEVYGNLGDCSMSGVMDEATCGAIRSLQKSCGMAQTGILDKALWMRLARLYTQAVGNGARKSDCQ